jgi:hypothetical protein
MQDGKEPAAARVRAAECLLDRGWGRAETTANVKVPRDVRELSTQEILERLARLGSTALPPVVIDNEDDTIVH